MLKSILLLAAVVLGILLRKRYSFLELVCNAAALVILIHELLGLLPSPQIPRLILFALLALGGIAYGITEVLVILAGRGTAKAPCDCIIVLGCKIVNSVPSFSLRDRIQAAADYLTKHPHTVAVLSGGQSEGETVSEAQYMFERLTETGIAPHRLILEERSENTWENLRFSAKLIDKEFGTRPERIGLLSSEYHLYRIAMYAGKQNLTAVTIPAPTSHFLTKLNGFMREGAGVWHQIILGGTYHERT